MYNTSSKEVCPQCCLLVLMEMVFPKKRNEGIRGILLMPVPRVWTIPRPVSLLDSYIYMSIGQINVLNRLVCLYFGYKTCFWLGFGQEWRTPKLHSLEMSHWNGNLLLRYQYVCILYTYIYPIPCFCLTTPDEITIETTECRFRPSRPLAGGNRSMGLADGKKIRCHPIQNWLVAWYLLLWTFHVTIPKEELMV